MKLSMLAMQRIWTEYKKMTDLTDWERAAFTDELMGKLHAMPGQQFHLRTIRVPLMRPLRAEMVDETTLSAPVEVAVIEFEVEGEWLV